MKIIDTLHFLLYRSISLSSGEDVLVLVLELVLGGVLVWRLLRFLILLLDPGCLRDCMQFRRVSSSLAPTRFCVNASNDDGDDHL
jgi:hypothetical protein